MKKTPFGSTMDWSLTKRAVDSAVRDLEPFRNQVGRLVAQYTGRPDGGRFTEVFQAAHGSDERLLNALGVLVEVLMQNLISGRPAAAVSSRDPSLAPVATMYKLALNRVLETIRFRDSLEESVMAALFGIGVIKTGVALTEADLYGQSWRYTAMPFADAVLLTNYVFDTTARSWREIRFEADVYEASIDDIEQDERNDPEIVRRLTPSKGFQTDFDQLRDKMLEGGFSWSPGPQTDKVQLIDVYLPTERLIATFPLDGPRPLRTQNYIGPPSGPYHKLQFHPVPGQLRGITPVEMAAPLAHLMSMLFADLGNQAARRKTVMMVDTKLGGEKDVGVINGARDGEAIPVSNPESVTERRMGGIDGQAAQFLAQVKDLFSWANGNADVIGGLATGASTLGQENLLKQTSNARIQRMQGKVNEFARGIMEAIGWYIWNDPNTMVKTVYKIAGVPEDIAMNFPMTPEMDGTESDVRNGTSWGNFEYAVEPYTMVAQSPAEKLQVVNGMLQQLIPLAPMLAQSGVTIDFQELVKLQAELGNVPQLLQVIKVANPEPSMTTGPQFDRPPKPATTTRIYERTSTGMSPGGWNRQMAANMPASEEE